MFIAQQLMLLVLRNAFEILVLTAVNHSETDWNIRHAFRIWAYTDYFGSPTTPLMSVFVRGNPEKKKSEIAKKKLGRSDFGGSVGAQQTDKILWMALSVQRTNNTQFVAALRSLIIEFRVASHISQFAF